MCQAPRDRSVHLFQRKSGILAADRLRRVPLLEPSQYRFQRDAGCADADDAIRIGRDVRSIFLHDALTWLSVKLSRIISSQDHWFLRERTKVRDWFQHPVFDRKRNPFAF